MRAMRAWMVAASCCIGASGCDGGHGAATADLTFEGEPCELGQVLQEEPCGINGRGTRRVVCGVASQKWSACDDPDRCVEGTAETQTCGGQPGYVRTRVCIGGQLEAWSGCVELFELPGAGGSDPAVPGDPGPGTQDPPDPADPDPEPTDPQPEPGDPTAPGPGDTPPPSPEPQPDPPPVPDPPVGECTEGVAESLACGLNGRGAKSRVCEGGAWRESACVDPDVCVDGAAQQRACDGVDATQTRRCQQGQYGAWSVCPQPPPVCGDERPNSPLTVYYGTREPTYLPLSDRQIAAIGMLDGKFQCSGTLISPRWVLTAAHCENAVGDVFCFGRGPSRYDACIEVTRVVHHGRVDLTMLQLRVDATTVVDVTPIPILVHDLDDSWLGRTAEAAGYGRTETGSSGERLFTAEPIVGLTSRLLTVSGEGRHGLCAGDSGGPVMVLANDASIRVAGALSNGDTSCVGEDNYTRTDTYRSWIETYAGPTPRPRDCAGVDAVGRCIDGIAVWCEDGGMRLEACAEPTSCAWSDGAGGYRCSEGPNPCGGVDTYGMCLDGVATWCDRGQLRQRDCGACGQFCGVDTARSQIYCVDDPCSGIAYEGLCDGNVARWCVDGKPQERDCSAIGQTCQYVNADTGYFCQ